MKPITRTAAALNGSPVYFTGKPCKHGHLATRYVVSSNCSTCTKDRVGAQRAQLRISIAAARAGAPA